MSEKNDVSSDTPSRRIELYVRSLSYPATYRQQGCLIDRLDRLEAAGTISEFDVLVWGKEIVLSGSTARTETGRRFLDRYRAFEEWADERAVSIGSFFEVKEVRSKMTGDEYTAVVFPVTVMVEFVGDRLEYVTPCSDGGDVCTIDDRFDALEAGLSDDADDADAVPELVDPDL